MPHRADLLGSWHGIAWYQQFMAMHAVHLFSHGRAACHDLNCSHAVETQEQLAVTAHSNALLSKGLQRLERQLARIPC